MVLMVKGRVGLVEEGMTLSSEQTWACERTGVESRHAGGVYVGEVEKGGVVRGYGGGVCCFRGRASRAP